jgi:hypothetical protein
MLNDYRVRIRCVLWLATANLLAQLAAPAFAEQRVSFREQVAPIMLERCLACHNAQKSESGYRVDSYDRLTAEGDSGLRGFSANDLDGSEAFRRITSTDANDRMPLESEPLPSDQIALIQRWIEAGIPYDAADPKVSLASIVPPPVHPDAPAKYFNTLPVTALAFSPDGQELFVSGYHEVTVWSPADGRLVRRISNVGQRTYALDFSPDGTLLAVGSGTPGRLGEVRLFDSAGRLMKVLGWGRDVVFDVAFSPLGDQLAAASADSTVRVYEIPSGEQNLTITSHSDWVTAICWNSEGTRLLTASRDETAKVFDAETGRLLLTYAGHSQPVQAVAFHPNDKQAFSGAADHKIHLWSLTDAKKAADLGSFGGPSKFVTGGGDLFAPTTDRAVRQIRLKDRQQVRSYVGCRDDVLAIAYHEKTQRLAAGSFDGEVRLWNAASGSPFAKFLAAPAYQPIETTEK